MSKKIILITAALLLTFSGVAVVWATQNNLFSYSSNIANAQNSLTDFELKAEWKSQGEIIGHFDETGTNYLNKELLDPLEKIYHIESEKEMYSRCLSGAFYSLGAKPPDYLSTEPDNKDPYFYGQIDLNIGCSYPISFLFRIHHHTKAIEVFSETQQKYISKDEWFKGPDAASKSKE